MHHTRLPNGVDTTHVLGRNKHAPTNFSSKTIFLQLKNYHNAFNQLGNYKKKKNICERIKKAPIYMPCCLSFLKVKVYFFTVF
jgi:hypothetical protein